MISESELAGLVGTTFPNGTFTLDAARNDAFIGAVQMSGSTAILAAGAAHPVFAHLATHVGKGVTLQQFVHMVGAELDSGMLFGEGELVWERPLEVGRTYLVVGGISAATRKRGERTGTFDAITTSIDLLDGEQLVCTSRETFIFPRQEADT